MNKDEEIKFQITAYHRWLMQITGGNVFKLAFEIANQAVHDQNPQAQKLIELTGEPYTVDTFHKAAQLLLTAIDEEKIADWKEYSNQFKEADEDEHPGDYKDKIDGY